MTLKTRTAEIAGAGLAGLAVAASLAQKGWNVRVHERSKDLREIGAGIYMWENVHAALKDLGVFDKVKEAGVESHYPRMLLDHRNKEVNLRRDKDSVPDLIVLLRTDLHRILAEAAISAGAEIVTNSRVIGATPEGNLEFSGGMGPRADLIVGADGVFSRVRDSLGLVKEMYQVRDGCGRHLIERKPDDPVNRQRIESWTSGRRVGIAPASKDYHYVFLCCPEDDIEGRLQQPFNLSAWTDSHPWLHQYLERMPKHPEEHWRPFYNVTCHRWSKGRSLIIGDAAHGMTPNLGQGAGVSIVNATSLARAVDGAQDIPEALRAWEAAERPYTDMTQRMSYVYGAVGTRWPRKLLTLRSKILPILSRADVFQRSLRCATDHVPAF
ncbi:NAD(P)/FAD-dependent oxidoreductase [Roseovarius sp. CAU 1744]|uniref:FAD-dependent oxidoreductase n=1 Tax=Roseovarius sp. CAU 1744 TaxID=3140368 RepID=UPI00325ABBCB